MSKKMRQGFSLVELMVVVAIIGILSSIAIPKFSQFQARARQTEAKTNLNVIHGLQSSYYANENCYYPEGVNTAGQCAIQTNPRPTAPKPAFNLQNAGGAKAALNLGLPATANGVTNGLGFRLEGGFNSIRYVYSVASSSETFKTNLGYWSGQAIARTAKIIDGTSKKTGKGKNQGGKPAVADTDEWAINSAKCSWAVYDDVKDTGDANGLSACAKAATNNK